MLRCGLEELVARRSGRDDERHAPPRRAVRRRTGGVVKVDDQFNWASSPHVAFLEGVAAATGSEPSIGGGLAMHRTRASKAPDEGPRGEVADALSEGQTTPS